MTDPLAAAALMEHICALADEIGPRPPGHPEEERARAYIRQRLNAMGYAAIEEQPFQTVDTPGYASSFPLAAVLIGALLGEAGRWGQLAGGLGALAAAASYLNYSGGGRQPLRRLAPQHPSANLIVRIPPAGPPRRRVVLIGHTDTQKYWAIFRPEYKRALLSLSTQGLGMMTMIGAALLARSAGLRPASWITRAGVLMLGSFIRQVIASDMHDYVAGANDNATAVACLLGLGATLRAAPLRETEVWLAFTGAEEVMCIGMHRLLDEYGAELRDAHFIDFEMVGSDEIVYVTRHSGLTLASAYRPDAQSLALAERTARSHPHLKVHGRDLVIVEEVGTLRRRGFRGICIAGVGPDGWLENWHLPSDTTENIKPAGVERAARFVLAMLHTLDQG